MELWVLAIFLCITVLIVFGGGYSLVKYYVDPRDSSALTTIVSMLALSVSLFCVFLIPVDIYTVSSSLNADGTQTDPDLVEHSGNVIKYMYYVFYMLLVALAFFVVPFAYFYFEEEGASMTVSQRACGALKYSIGFVIFFAVLLTLGLVLKRDKFDEDNKWVDKLSDGFSSGDAIMSFLVSTLACLGLPGWITYVSYGLANVPLSLLRSRRAKVPLLNTEARASRTESSRGLFGQPKRGRRDRDEIKDMGATEIEVALKKNQELINYIESKYQLSKRRKTDEDEKELRRLQTERRQLIRRQGDLDRRVQTSGVQAVSDFSAKCWSCLAPVRWLLAIPLFALSVLLVLSMLLSTIDRFMHSTCKASCGYTLDVPEIINPLDEALKVFSKVFPIDFILFGALVTYIFVAAISGLVSLGVRFFVVHLYDFRPKRTEPQALLMGSWFLMFMVLALNMLVLLLSPQYATFGTQFYMQYNNATAVYDKKPCELSQLASNSTADASYDACVLTQVATFINTSNVQLPFFGVVMFYGNLLFLALYVIFQMVAIFREKPPSSDYAELADPADEV